MTGELNVLDSNGHTKIIWDEDDAESVKQARRTFDELKAKRYLAYSVEKGGEKGEVLHSFDPGLEAMILSPPVVGG